MAADLGIQVDLGGVAKDSPDFAAAYSESAGRFLVSLDPARQSRFEELFKGQPVYLLGEVRQDRVLQVNRGEPLLQASLEDLGSAWQRRFGNLI
jgi:phosphoribosylformylglycinamidine synthase